MRKFAPWECNLANRLLKRAEIHWEVLPPLPGAEFYKLGLPGLVSFSAIERHLPVRSRTWLGEVWDFITNLAEKANVPLQLPEDPFTHVHKWVRPKEWVVEGRPFRAFLNLPFPVKGDPEPALDVLDQLKEEYKYPAEILSNWIDKIDRELRPLPEKLRLVIIKSILEPYHAGKVLFAPRLGEKGITPGPPGDKLPPAEHYPDPIIHVGLSRAFPRVALHELGHALIPSVEAQPDQGYRRELNPEISNMAALHVLAPHFVNLIREEIGESPLSAQSLGQLLDDLISGHRRYFEYLRSPNYFRFTTEPLPVTQAHEDLAFSPLAALNQLTDQWGQAVRAYATQHLTGKPVEDPRVTAARMKLQNLMAYIFAAAARAKYVPLDQIDFSQVLSVLADARHITYKAPDLEKMFQILAQGPKTPEDLATFLDIAKKHIPEIEKSYPYQWIQKLTSRSGGKSHLLQRITQYPAIGEIPKFR